METWSRQWRDSWLEHIEQLNDINDYETLWDRISLCLNTLKLVSFKVIENNVRWSLNPQFGPTKFYYKTSSVITEMAPITEAP